ncbi:hypothetical protein Tco_0952220 [Tanacetum coccineum]|uniref:Uncharacterized protein n=1 Tax=Tanacetum coccineum TaxID=301880 RepID=A0ABQ5DWD7_9ASTR
MKDIDWNKLVITDEIMDYVVVRYGKTNCKGYDSLFGIIVDDIWNKFKEDPKVLEVAALVVSERFQKLQRFQRLSNVSNVAYGDSDPVIIVFGLEGNVNEKFVVIVVSSTEEISSDEGFSFLYNEDDDIDSDNDSDSSIYEEEKVASKPKHASKPTFSYTNDDDDDDIDSDTDSESSIYEEPKDASKTKVA